MSSINFGQMVVRQHRPWRSLILVLVLIALVVAAAWLAFEFGRVKAGFDRIEFAAKVGTLKQQISRLEKQVKGFRETSAVMERSSQIDRQANSFVKGSVKELQAEILELKEGIAFYRNIVSPNQSSAGIRIQSLSLVGGGPQRIYRYSLMLTQVLKNDRLAKGNIEFVIDGLLDGAPAKLALDKLKTRAKLETGFKFKYFQSLEGEFRLPEGFEPRAVTVDVKPKGKRLTRVTDTIAWSAILSEG